MTLIGIYFTIGITLWGIPVVKNQLYVKFKQLLRLGKPFCAILMSDFQSYKGK